MKKIKRVEWSSKEQKAKNKARKALLPKTFELDFLREYGKKPTQEQAEVYAKVMNISYWKIEGWLSCRDDQNYEEKEKEIKEEVEYD